MREDSLHGLSAWQPGAWCAATLRLCERHEAVDPCGTACYPEQWAYMLWRPDERALPFRRPDCWGLSVGPPEPSLTETVGTDPIYLLAPQQCGWSSWLDLILVTGQFEPWLTNLLQRAREHEHAAERSRYLRWFGSERHDFEQFLNKSIGLT